MIPLEIQLDFYEGFFVDGWDFFYKVCVSIIKSINLINQNYSDPEDVYIALKLGKYTDIDKQDKIKKWKEIIKNAYKLEINS